MRALGIDVGVRKGQDLVLIETPKAIAATETHVAVDDLPRLIEILRPDVIAIDAPPRFGEGKRRSTEVDLQARGVSLFATPWLTEQQAKPFYGWMREGFRIFEMAMASGFPLYDGSGYNDTAIEVFPYAAAVVLSGGLKPKGTRKGPWRRRVLQAAGVDPTSLRGVDQIDAALAALTGLKALTGEATWEGEPAEGVIVLPCSATELQPKYRMPGL